MCACVCGVGGAIDVCICDPTDPTSDPRAHGAPQALTMAPSPPDDPPADLWAKKEERGSRAVRVFAVVVVVMRPAFQGKFQRQKEREEAAEAEAKGNLSRSYGLEVRP